MTVSSVCYKFAEGELVNFIASQDKVDDVLTKILFIITPNMVQAPMGAQGGAQHSRHTGACRPVPRAYRPRQRALTYFGCLYSSITLTKSNPPSLIF